MKIRITLPNSKRVTAEKGISAKELVRLLNPRLGKRALAVRIDGKLYELSKKINSDSKVEVITFGDEEGRKLMWHSASHVLASAVVELFPEAKPVIGPAIDTGFYYDFYREKPFDAKEIELIEKKVRALLDAGQNFERYAVKKEDALKFYRGNKFKRELIKALPGKTVSFYKLGGFADLCKGPHIPSSGLIKGFKIINDTSAYWRGDAKKESLRRLYGIAFPSKKELEDYLKFMEEIEKRDHRKIGKQLRLFSLHDEGQGFPFMLPNGVIIINELLKLWREVHRKSGYKEIRTPVILKKELWEKSGHWTNYRDSMYTLKIDGEDYAIKPMNCPGGMLVYNETIHSYKELPLRVGEIGLDHRHELSGTLAGLFRVRAFWQDDAHIYMMPEQLVDEIIGIIDLVDYFYKKFGFDYHIELSTRPPKSIGTAEEWALAENSLKEALKRKKVDYKLNPGEGAFYGPKIDFHIKDCLGRTWQCATIQVDMALPRRFNLKYVGKDNKDHRPVMIHCVIYGSIERFIGVLIEHFAGAFPTWLAPEQVRIMPIADRHVKYARKVAETFEEKEVRHSIDGSPATVQYKIRNAQLDKVPYMIVLGDREENEGKITVRTRDGKVKYGVSLNNFMKQLCEEIKERKLS